MPAIGINACRASPPHRVEKCSNSLLWEVVPLFYSGCDELLAISGRRTSAGNGSFQLVPQMLNWREIWGVRGPVKYRDLVVLSGMPWSVAQNVDGRCLAENPDLRVLIQEGNNDGLKNLLHVTLGVERSIDDHQGRPCIVADAGPHHYTGSTPTISLLDTSVLETLSLSSPDSGAAIGSIYAYPALVSEENGSPSG
jgi:hypothetical protein